MQVGRMDANHSNEQQQYYFKHSPGNAVPLNASGGGSLYPAATSPVGTAVGPNILGVPSILSTPGSPTIVGAASTLSTQQQPILNHISTGVDSGPSGQTNIISTGSQQQPTQNSQSISPSAAKKRRQKRCSPVNSLSPKNNFPMHLLNSGDMTAAPTELTLLVQQAMHPPLTDTYVPPPPQPQSSSYLHTITSTTGGLSPRGATNNPLPLNSIANSSPVLSNYSHPALTSQLIDSNKTLSIPAVSLCSPVTSTSMALSSNNDNNINLSFNPCSVSVDDSVSNCTIDSCVTPPTIGTIPSHRPTLPLKHTHSIQSNSDSDISNPLLDSSISQLSLLPENNLASVSIKDSKPSSETRSNDTPIPLESDTNDSITPAYAVSGSDNADDDCSKDFIYQVHTPSTTPSPSPSLVQTKWKMDLVKLQSTIESVLHMASSDEPYEDIFVLPPRMREAFQRITPMGPPNTPGPSISPRQPASPRQQTLPSSPVLSNSSPQPPSFSPSPSVYSIPMPQPVMPQTRPTITHTHQRIQQPYLTSGGTTMTNFFVEHGPATPGVASTIQRPILTQQKQTGPQIQSNAQISTFQPTVFIQQQPPSTDGITQSSVSIPQHQQIHYAAHPVQAQSILQQQQLQPQQQLFMHHTPGQPVQTTQIIGQRQVFPVVQPQSQSHTFVTAAQVTQAPHTSAQSTVFPVRQQPIQQQVISNARLAYTVHKQPVSENQTESNSDKSTIGQSFIQQHPPSGVVTITQHNLIQTQQQAQLQQTQQSQLQQTQQTILQQPQQPLLQLQQPQLQQPQQPLLQQSQQSLLQQNQLQQTQQPMMQQTQQPLLQQTQQALLQQPLSLTHNQNVQQLAPSQATLVQSNVFPNQQQFSVATSVPISTPNHMDPPSGTQVLPASQPLNKFIPSTTPNTVSTNASSILKSSSMGFSASVVSTLPTSAIGALSAATKKRPNNNTKGSSTKRRKPNPSITQAEQKKMSDEQKNYESMIEKLKTPSLTNLIHQPKISPFTIVLPPRGSTYDAKYQWNNVIDELDWLDGKTFKYKHCQFSLKFPKPDTSFIESDYGDVSLSEKDIDRIASSENKFIAQHLTTTIPDGPMLHILPNKTMISETDAPLSPVCPSPAPQTLENQVVLLMSKDKQSEPSPKITSEPSRQPLLHMFYPSNGADGQCDRSSPPLTMFHFPNPKLLQKLSASSQNKSLISAESEQKSSADMFPTELNNTNQSMMSTTPTELTVSTGLSTVQLTINGAHSGSVLSSQGGAGSSPLVDSETGEVLTVRNSTSGQTASENQSSDQREVGHDLTKDKIHLTFTLSPKSPDNVQNLVKNITDMLGINYDSVNYQVTRTDLNTELTMDPKSSLGPQRYQELEQKLRDQIAPLSLRLQKDDACSDQGLITPTATPTPNSCSTLSMCQGFPTTISSASAIISKHEEEQVSVSVLKAFKKEDNYCKHCEMLVHPNTGVVKKLSELQTNLGFSLKSDQDIDEIIFCSTLCATQFIQCIADTDLAIQRSKDDNFLNVGFNITGATASAGTCKENSHVIEYRQQFFNVPVVLQGPPPRNLKSVPRRQLSHTGDKVGIRKKSDSKMSSSKRWLGIRWKNYSQMTSNPPKKRVALTEAEVIELLQKQSGALRLSGVTDQRMCALCHVKGDAGEDGPGRLLCLDIDKWLHINCALWCFDIYETLGGSLNSVDACYRRAIMTMCSYCGLYGAGLPCYNPRCSVVYHLPCAQAAGCMFFTDRGMYCQLHQPKEHHMHLKSLSVNRRVYITRDENKQVAKVIHEEDQKHIVRIGSLMLHSVGQLLPHQIDRGTFHTRRHIFPVGFTTTRIYWSMRRPRARCSYRCSIRDSDGKPAFVVTAIEEGLENESIMNESCELVWKTILERIERLRIEHSLVKMFPQHMQPEELFGLTEPHIVRAIESLPGVESLQDYAFKFGRLQLIAEMPLAVNPSGSARSEPKMRTYFRRPRFVHAGSSSSRSFVPLRMAGPGDEQTPYSKQYISSRSQQYRKLKSDSKNNVILGRSRIQGLGLNAARDLEKYTMIIEYIGQLIRAGLANKREKEYDEHNRGTYMFRLDDNMILDATISGGLARYINHSCQPNCVAEVVSFEKESHIIIFANKRIERGEELTYDYKFDYEDSGNKIPCLCGAPMCRKWMN